MGNRLMEIDNRRCNINKTRRREKKLEPIPEGETSRRVKRREPSKVKKTQHLAFSYQDQNEPLGRWVRYPPTLSTELFIHDNLSASFNTYRQLPGIKEGQLECDDKYGDIIETVALSNASQSDVTDTVLQYNASNCDVTDTVVQSNASYCDVSRHSHTI